MTTAAPAVLCLLICVSGCSGAAAAGAASVRDSAGVEIVTSVRPAWSGGDGWRVDAEPAADIGPATGSGGPRLEDARGAVRLPSGEIVVANGLPQALLWYDRHGRFERAVGREGSGPGELSSVERLEPFGDGGLVAWDAGKLRVARFDGDGAARWTRPFPAERLGIDAHVEGIFADGSLLLSSGERNVFHVSPRARREPFLLLRHDYARRRLDTLRSERGREEFTWGDSRSATRRPAPFARETFVAAHANRVWVADNERCEVRIYSPRGRLARITRWSAPPVPVSAHDRQAVTDDFLRRAQGSLGADSARRVAAKLPFPTTFPAFAALRVSRAGETWLRRGDPGQEGTWIVFDRGGRLLGDVSLPPELDPLEIGDDYVLGTWSGDPHGEHIRLYRLRK